MMFEMNHCKIKQILHKHNQLEDALQAAQQLDLFHLCSSPEQLKP